MAENEGLRVTGEAIVLSLTPDYCKTPPSMAPVPYQILGRFSDGVRYVDNVCMTGMNAMTMDGRLTTVYGDEAGTGGGVISGVNLGYCRPITHSPTVRVKGHHVVFHTSQYWMNCDGPDGTGNTIGQVTYVENINDVYIGPLGEIEGDTCPPVAPEVEEEKSWWEKAAPWVHGALDVVGMIPGVGEVADLANAAIYLAEGDYGNAAMSAMGAIPLVGNVATAAKVAKAVDKAADAAKAIDKARDMAKAVDKASAAAKAVDKAKDGAKAADKAKDTTRVTTRRAKNPGRSGKQPRLREMANDPKLSSRERGWIKQELNQIKRGKRRNIRVPFGREMAHRKGFEAAKGYSYKYSDLQDIGIHRIETRLQRRR